ncbi:type 4a pilus biogenesis protein PilO [bacterium]|nr:type 4a pilus biogenesis protein PilO [bacterium]
MEKYSRYYGVICFVLAVIALFVIAYFLLIPRVNELNQITSNIQSRNAELEKKRAEKANIERKKKQLSESLISVQKKIYSPVDSGLENDTLFFTLYNDVIEMLHSNSIKIKSIDYAYNPAGDPFVEHGKDSYFVCDINMQVVSNYVNLGKFVQDVYQYPYLIRINKIDTTPYNRDKKILISDISLRVYAHTTPEEPSSQGDASPLAGADTAIPQE